MGETGQARREAKKATTAAFKAELTRQERVHEQARQAAIGVGVRL
jgi:hypothetical protein